MPGAMADAVASAFRRKRGPKRHRQGRRAATADPAAQHIEVRVSERLAFARAEDIKQDEL